MQRIFAGAATGFALLVSGPAHEAVTFQAPAYQLSHTFSSQLAELDQRELRCLAMNVYYEARGEQPEGQLAVAHVTLNRLRAEIQPVSLENFQRFLENWSASTYTYNGSLVKMYASVYATNVWGKANVYNPPTRQFYFDLNYNNPSLLPPLTPSLQTIYRDQWATVASTQTNATSTLW